VFTRLSNMPRERTQLSYPYCYWNDGFTSEELDKMCTYFSTFDLEKAKVFGQGEQVVPKIRSSDIKFHMFNPQNNDTNWIFMKLNNIIDNLNNQYFNYNLNGYDKIQYGEYKSEDSGKYNFHIDMGITIPQNLDDSCFRKLSLTLLLNEPGVDFEGGDFEFMFSDNVEKVPEDKLKKGTVILFPSFLLHRVKSVTKGTRKSLVVWVTGPKFI